MLLTSEAANPGSRPARAPVASLPDLFGDQNSPGNLHMKLDPPRRLRHHRQLEHPPVPPRLHRLAARPDHPRSTWRSSWWTTAPTTDPRKRCRTPSGRHADRERRQPRLRQGQQHRLRGRHRPVPVPGQHRRDRPRWGARQDGGVPAMPTPASGVVGPRTVTRDLASPTELPALPDSAQRCWRLPDAEARSCRASNASKVGRSRPPPTRSPTMQRCCRAAS